MSNTQLTFAFGVAGLVAGLLVFSFGLAYGAPKAVLGLGAAMAAIGVVFAVGSALVAKSRGEFDRWL